MKGRDQWKSQFGFLLAAVGSAIGLGNIWRFSYMAYSNGGGAFLIPYITALLTAGIPLLILEFAVGHERIGSAPLAFRKIGRNWEWLGWWAVIFVMFGIELYYSSIIAWCLDYIVIAANLGWGEDTKGYFFNTFLGLSGSPWDIGTPRPAILAGLAVVWILNWGILYRGIQRGVELANKIFMPLLLVITTILVLWAITLPGAALGIRAYLTPDFSKLLSWKVWIDAYSQIFFTLSLGFGIMIAYASYLPENTDIPKSAFLTGVINCSYSLFAGFAVFAVLGFMAQAQNVAVSEVVSQSIGLAFVAYPKAISLMPGGPMFGIAFFLCLFIAGMSSSISILEAFTSAVVDKFGASREKVVTVVSVMGFLGSIIFTTNGGLFWLDIVDHFLTSYGLISVGIFQCILIGWVFKVTVLRSHINKYASIKLGAWWNIFIKFIIPIILGIIVSGTLYTEFQKPYEGYPKSALFGIGVLWIVGTLIASVIFASRPWNSDNHRSGGRSDNASGE